MSLNTYEISSLVKELRSLLLNTFFVGAGEKEERKIYLKFKTHAQQLYTLLFCFQEPFLRFHLVTEREKWQQQALAKKIIYYLEGSRLTNLEQIQGDRILSLSFSKEGKSFRIIGEFFSKRPNFFLLDQSLKLLGTLNAVKHLIYKPPETSFKMPSGTPVCVDSGRIAQKYAILEKEAEFRKRKAQLFRRMHEKYKGCLRQVKKNTDEIKYLLQWPQTQHQAELLQANLYRIPKGTEKVIVQDWNQEGAEIELFLNPHQNPLEIVQGLYKKVKKMRGGLERCSKDLKQNSTLLKQWQEGLEAVEQACSWDELYSICKTWKISETPAQKHLLPALPYYAYTSSSGLKIWVGKGAKENEKLTFSYAKGSDWWLHVRDYPGAHVVICTLKGQRPDEASLKEALQVALAYSKAKDKGVVEVILSQCKYIVRSKQKTGRVHISHQEIFQACFDAKSFQTIKQRGRGSC